MSSCTKFWIRDASVYGKQLYNLLNAQNDDVEKPKRSSTGAIFYNKNKIKKPSTPDLLIPFLENRAAKILSRLNNKHYLPSDATIQDFKLLLRQECKEYLEQVQDDTLVQQKIQAIYSCLEERLAQEEKRKHPKYAISLRELIELQKKSSDAEEHNEILACNTKSAVRALYACKDTLFDRLNLAFHALQIKKQYHYDLPLLIISENKSPYHYSEAMIKADLEDAYHLLKNNNFPYDRELFPVYELDKNGLFVIRKGEAVIKKNERGHEIKEPKNIRYQLNLLRDLFQLGLPQLQNINQLRQGKLGKTEITEKQIQTAISSIVEQMDVIGNIRREKKLMRKIFSKPDQKPKEKFFLRTVALGHQTLIKEILDRSDFKPSLALLEKSIQFAMKNNHAELKESLKELWLTENIEFKELQSLANQLDSFADLPSEAQIAAQKKRIEIIINVMNRAQVLQHQIELPLEFSQLIQQKIPEVFLNNASRGNKNTALILKFKEILDKNPILIHPYAQMFTNNQMLKLDKLIEIYNQLGIKHLFNILTIVGTRGWEAGNNYRLLIEFNQTEKAEQYLKDKHSLKNENLGNIKEECEKLIGQIEKAGFGKKDTATQDYCKAVREMVEKGEADFVLMAMILQQLKQIDKSVNSPEMRAIKQQVERLEKNSESFFSIGNRSKATRIKSAVAKVPLIERIHIFSNESSSTCNKVRIALASHRISFTNSVNKSNKVVSENAAKSFIEVEKIANSEQAKEAIRLFYHTPIAEKTEDEITIASPLVKSI
ncbi:hypothetical protein EP47_09580 [Legionella norrlandica]|uniref:Uncharacterized protein n=1 Tax=Legionella norrlandica TaxID=1498499 RepID=A0A0A2SQS0_9GAMM|nr:hypothetical protein [Legionella norrlandica]KGP63450.1 hypothetical protein EP47_09580 [Legionella norrlandica]